MKKIYLFFWILFCSVEIFGQSTDVYPSNVNISTLEKNILFFAHKRYVVSQTGTAKLDTNVVFDGRFSPFYTAVGPSEADPTVVLIENLPNAHVQSGAWVGWSTRAWGATKFKIEVYNTYANTNTQYPQANTWVTVADISNYTKNDYAVKLNYVQPSKIRFTFYTASGSLGRLGVSELFYLHPEAAQAYDGLMAKYDDFGDFKINSFKNLKLGNYAFLQEQNAIENGYDRAIFAQGATWDNSNKRYDLSSNKLYNRNGIILGNRGIKFFGHTGDLTSNPYWSNTDMSNNVKMVINHDGRVGIGTSDPLGLLEMSGIGVPTGMFRVITTGGGGFTIGAIDNTPNPVWRIGTNASEALSFEVGGISGGLYLNHNANTGLGTTSPQSKLHVGVTQRTASGDQNADIISSNGLIIGSGKMLSLDHNYFTHASMVFNTSVGNEARFVHQGYYGHAFTTRGNIPRMIILGGTGQVLIGTSTPYLDYKLAVAGNIVADKIKVKKSTNGMWPDFVFLPTYHLPNLTEVESFVKQNNHLPEIPSAAEIEKDGQDLGEMNRLLLKKVEELTLYLIEQNKKVEILQTEISELKKEIKK